MWITFRGNNLEYINFEGLNRKSMNKIKLEYFKTVNLYDIYGGNIFGTKTTKQWEKICEELFHLERPNNHDKNRGDFYYEIGEDNKVFLDHKTCKVFTENVAGDEYFIKVKYSNVISKLWVQMAMRELDSILKYIPFNNKTFILRHKTEFTIQDIKDIDTDIWNFLQSIKDKVIETDSYCLKHKIKFHTFCNELCRYNVRNYANLLIIHDCPDYDRDNWINYYHNRGEQYLLTPIDIGMAQVYLDYIGFGGFKVAICKFPLEKKPVPKDEMSLLFDELDLLFDLIKYQNKIIGNNEACNSLSKLSGNGYYKLYVKDKWDFEKFKPSDKRYSMFRQIHGRKILTYPERD